MNLIDALNIRITAYQDEAIKRKILDRKLRRQEAKYKRELNEELKVLRFKKSKGYGKYRRLTMDDLFELEYFFEKASFLTSSYLTSRVPKDNEWTVTMVSLKITPN